MRTKFGYRSSGTPGSPILLCLRRHACPIAREPLAESSIPPSIILPHIDKTIRSIAQLHADHHQNATRIQRGVDHLTRLLGRPIFVGMLTLFIVGWIGSNLTAGALGVHPIDPPPFVWLLGAISLMSLYVVILVLATQRREDELAQRRDQLTLELAILSEQKATKVIQLLEEARRDNPLIRDRIDQEAEEMAQPSDPQTVLGRIEDSHAEAEKIGDLQIAAAARRPRPRR
jgi:uncharacterized membrane protein